MELKNFKLIHTFDLQLTREETHYILNLVWPHDISSHIQKFILVFIFWLIWIWGFGVVGVFLGGKIFFFYFTKVFQGLTQQHFSGSLIICDQRSSVSAKYQLLKRNLETHKY